MMDSEAPIGVFDSGVGGLSVLLAIRAALPTEHLVYLADSAHAPYGDRDADFVRERVVGMVDRLVDSGVKAVVVACNTASVLAADHLRRRHALPIVAMEPAIKPAVLLTRSKVVGVLATRQTLASAAVARLCEQHGAAARILLQPCPGLVERIEAGDLHGAATRELLDRFVTPLVDDGADVLVLGCTHYPFVVDVIREIAGPDVVIVDAAIAVAAQLAIRVERQSGHGPDEQGTVRFETTSSSQDGSRIFSMFWGEPVTVEPASSMTSRSPGRVVTTR